MSRIVSFHACSSAIDDALNVLNGGGLVVFPTDTVYGVGASVRHPEAVAKLYVAKGRPLERAIPVLVSGESSVENLTSDVPDSARKLIQQFWPGPLTIVLPAAEWLPEEIVRDTGCVGLRMPDHPVALALIERSGGALATTSANRSGAPETWTAESAAAQIGDRVELVLDGGDAPGGVPSTVVRVESDGRWVILREGAVSPQAISDALG